jgi:YD repeat-containing protein
VTGQQYVFTYGTNNLTEVDREGTTRRYFYHGTSKAITSIEVEMGATDHVTNYSWESSTALLTKIEFPEGNGLRYVYSNGRLTTVARSTATGLTGTITRTDDNYLVTSYTYQSATNWTLVTKVTDPKGNDWLLERNGDGNITKYKTHERNVDADAWVLTYDTKSRPITLTDPEDRVTAYDYGATGILTKISKHPATLNLQTTYTRDKYENVITLTDPESDTTVYLRNELGYVTKIKSPEAWETDYS